LNASQNNPYNTPILKQFNRSGTTFPFRNHFNKPLGLFAAYNTEDKNSARNMIEKQMVASPGDSGCGKNAHIEKPTKMQIRAKGSIRKFRLMRSRTASITLPTLVLTRVSPSFPGGVVEATRARILKPRPVDAGRAMAPTRTRVAPVALCARRACRLEGTHTAEHLAEVFPAPRRTAVAPTPANAPIAAIFVIKPRLVV